MDCEDYQLLMVPHVLGQQGGLQVMEIVRLEAHLLECQSCAREYAEYARVVQAIRELPPEMLAQAFSAPSKGEVDVGPAQDLTEANDVFSGSAPSIQVCGRKGPAVKCRPRKLRIGVLVSTVLATCLAMVFVGWLCVRGSGQLLEAAHLAARRDECTGGGVMGSVQAVDGAGLRLPSQS